MVERSDSPPCRGGREIRPEDGRGRPAVPDSGPRQPSHADLVRRRRCKGADGGRGSPTLEGAATPRLEHDPGAAPRRGRAEVAVSPAPARGPRQYLGAVSDDPAAPAPPPHAH